MREKGFPYGLQETVFRDRTVPLLRLPSPADAHRNPSFEIRLTEALILLTLFLGGMASLEMSGILLSRVRNTDLPGAAGQAVF
ncbi:MAG TPA: hypothetical protein VF847_07480, partial [Candidatus Deferrimicrobiaceae bacterium]